MNKVINCYCLTYILILGSCKKQLPKAEYVKYLQNPANGAKREILIDGWKYEIQYKTPALIMVQEQLSQTSIAARSEQLKGTVWFNVSFMRADGNISPLRYNISSREEYEQRFNYFLNNASGQLKLIYKNDTLQPIAYEFENNFNLSPKETMVVGFKLNQDDQPDDNLQLVYRDEIFNNGLIKAIVTKETLKKIPAIKY